MSSNLPRTPSTIMNLHISRGINSMFRDARGGSVARPPSGSPRSTMANDEEEDPNEEQQNMTNTLLAVSAPAAIFSSADKELLESGKYADAKIIANGKTYDVHKNVLCTRSKWFRSVLEGAFREGQESVIEITAPDNIERVLEFLYTGAVDLSNEDDLMAAANELSALGDFYLSDEMNNYANQVLGKYLGEYLNSICDINKCADLPNEYSAAEYRTFLWDPLPEGRPIMSSTYNLMLQNFRFLHAKGFIDRLCSAIRAAYAIPSGIQRVYVDFVYTARIQTFGSTLIRALRDEVPEFGYDLLTAVMTGPLTTAFQGNSAFEQWKDPFANPELVATVEESHRHEQRVRDDRDRERVALGLPGALLDGPDINGVDNLGHTPPVSAVQNVNGESYIIEELIYAGAKEHDAGLVLPLVRDINALEPQGQTALHYWALRDGAAVADVLLGPPGIEIDTRNSSGRTALQVAAGMVSGGVLEELIRAGADLELVAAEKSAESLSAEITALETAVSCRQQVDAAMLQMRAGADTRFGLRDGVVAHTVLHAVVYGNETFLCQKTAGPLNEFTTRGHTPFLHAIYYGDVEGVSALLEAGADHLKHRHLQEMSLGGTPLQLVNTTLRRATQSGDVPKIPSVRKAGKATINDYLARLENIRSILNRRSGTDKEM
ncbi:hypothetical protein INS49_005341 [Diaporthe citri]|uniref:uncharacterized protein n=1 Tax=Diaporthe citri TaxID=83186 RepID=UPI001C7EB216|nr:uncharacterized protein INS49_005341 [Diaporthe citri]KAG6353633.1 hypothetical protein INS49_005341 [Diaporthe citri]